MIRVLVMIAVAGFLVATVAFGSALAIGGPDAIARGVWAWGPGAWDGNWGEHRPHRWDRHGRHWPDDDDGPQTVRQMVWTGGESVDLDVPANMTFNQGPGPARLTITGPRGVVEDLVVQDGHIGFGNRGAMRGRLTIELTAPKVTRFDLGGRGRLTIENYDQDSLSVDLTGNAEVVGRGRTKALDLDMSGSSEADFGGLAADNAEVEVTGSGEAVVAPRDSARIDISGSGDVTLKTRPAKLASDVSGSGKIHQEDGVSPSPSPSPSPSASPPAAASSRR
jgi:hypothetical protein